MQIFSKNIVSYLVACRLIVFDQGLRFDVCGLRDFSYEAEGNRGLQRPPRGSRPQIYLCWYGAYFDIKKYLLFFDKGWNEKKMR